VGCLLVDLHCRADFARLEVKIAELVVERQLVVDLGAVLELDDQPLVDADRLLPLLLDLVLAGSVFGSLDVQDEPRPAEE
jgi:hypothetical protein